MPAETKIQTQSEVEEKMVDLPDTGSDVSSLQTKAEPSNLNGIKGWKINGSKAWSTFQEEPMFWLYLPEQMKT